MELYNETESFTSSVSHSELVAEMKSKLSRLRTFQKRASMAIRESFLSKLIGSTTRSNPADDFEKDEELRLEKVSQMERFGWRNILCKRTSAPPTIDGRPEKLWEKAEPLTDFITYPTKKRVEVSRMPEEYQSEIRFLYDDTNLYFLGRMKYEHRPQLPSRYRDLPRVGNDYPYNWRYRCVELFFDPTHHHLNYFQIVVDILGRKTDQYGGIPGRGFPAGARWDSKIELRATLLEKEWIVEGAIPFDSFKAKPSSGSVWGFFVGRKSARGNTMCSLLLGGVVGYHKVSQYPHLIFQ